VAEHRGPDLFLYFAEQRKSDVRRLMQNAKPTAINAPSAIPMA
jgi:hypothetical protein